VRILQKAQELDPDFFVIHQSPADLYEAKGEHAKAVAELQLMIYFWRQSLGQRKSGYCLRLGRK